MEGSQRRVMGGEIGADGDEGGRDDTGATTHCALACMQFRLDIDVNMYILVAK